MIDASNFNRELNRIWKFPWLDQACNLILKEVYRQRTWTRLQLPSQISTMMPFRPDPKCQLTSHGLFTHWQSKFRLEEPRQEGLCGLLMSRLPGSSRATRVQLQKPRTIYCSSKSFEILPSNHPQCAWNLPKSTSIIICSHRCHSRWGYQRRRDSCPHPISFCPARSTVVSHNPSSSFWVYSGFHIYLKTVPCHWYWLECLWGSWRHHPRVRPIAASSRAHRSSLPWLLEWWFKRRWWRHIPGLWEWSQWGTGFVLQLIWPTISSDFFLQIIVQTWAMRIKIYLAKELEIKSLIKQQLTSGILGRTELWVFC